MHWILFVFILIPQFQNIRGLQLVDNGYKDLYVVIDRTAKENHTLLDIIQKSLTDASALLYTATHKRVFFKSVKVIVPSSWKMNKAYPNISMLTSSTSHIRVGDDTSIQGPFVLRSGSRTCGDRGLYMYLPAEDFFLNRTRHGSTLWGNPDSVIVHEWGHLRWGLWDEYPTIMLNGRLSSFFTEAGIWKPISCTRNIKGFAALNCKTGEGISECDQSDAGKNMPSSCRFCPESEQNVNASIMSYQYIASIVEFCDKDDETTPEYMRHYSNATNAQNVFCDGKSSWEVMREHQDFKDGNSLSLTGDFPPKTEFQFFQEIENLVRVLVLDTSGSMDGQRMTNLRKVSQLIIEAVLPEGTWLRLVDFDDNAVFLSEFVQINSATKPVLINALPTEGYGSTCIPCGLDLALNALRDFQYLDTTEETGVIIISDGENGLGNLTEAIHNCIDAGVIVFSIAATEAADNRLLEIAEKTGGRAFAYSDDGEISLVDVFAEILTGGLSTIPYLASTLKSEQISSSVNVPVNTSFTIDEGLGKDTTVTVRTKESSSITIRLTGPGNFSQNTSSATQVEMLSLFAYVITEPGKYIAEITTSASKFEVIVTSKPISDSLKIIRPFVRLSTTTLDFRNTSNLPVMYVFLRRGEAPVKRAEVQAIVEGPRGTETCALKLSDNGVDPDVNSGDGIYSAAILRECQSDNGRHSSKVLITGTLETVVTEYTASESALIYADSQVAKDIPTGDFERVAVTEAYTVSNFDMDLVSKDETPPGRITDIQVIDIHSGVPSRFMTRNYTITWTATGDDFSSGQAHSYEMRISKDRDTLRRDFIAAELLNVTGMTPNVSGKVERLQMVVSSNDAFTSSAYFAIVAIDDVGNRGKVSNIVPITIGQSSQFEAAEEECTNDCYAVLKDCGKTLTIDNGRVNFTDVLTTAGNSVPVICDLGYKLTGGTEIECQENGIWSQTVGCDIVDCGQNVTIPNGQIDFTNELTTYGQSLSVTCDRGYNITGGTHIECLANGSWSKTSGCQIIDCGQNITVSNGRVDFSDKLTTYGQSVSVTCDTGYNITGETHIECLPNGSWSKTSGCQIIDCGKSVIIINGQVNLTGAETTYGHSIQILCDIGFDFNGAPTLTCLAEGTWSQSSQCAPVDCGSSIHIINGEANFTGRNTTFGQTIPVSCNSGFHLNGAGNITCLADGMWSKVPTCSAPESRMDQTTIGIITGSCLGLLFLVITGLLILIVIRNKRRRILRIPSHSVEDAVDKNAKVRTLEISTSTVKVK